MAARFDGDGVSGGQELGWQGGYDWELYPDKRPMEALLYDEDMLIAKVQAKGRRRLARKMRRAQRRLGIRKATLF